LKKVAAALLVNDNKILIAQRKSTDKLAGKWEFPGGKLEPGETLEECLKREMHEEFGIEVEVGEFFLQKVLFITKLVQLFSMHSGVHGSLEK
jgi:8-oxo-dGTP diphosphatase